MRLSELYPDFWASFKIEDAVRRDLFSASRIGPVNYMARPAGITGANFVAGLTRTGALVQCEVMFNTRHADRETLLRLGAEIEREAGRILESLGPDYTLEEADHAVSLRKVLNGNGNIRHKPSWEQLAEELVAEVYHLFDVMDPFIEVTLLKIQSETTKQNEGRNHAEQIMLPT